MEAQAGIATRFAVCGCGGDWAGGALQFNGVPSGKGPTIDMIWVGRLGTASMAGVGISGMAVMVVNSLRMGLQTGTRAMIARFVGAGDEQGANHVAQQAFVVSAAFSTVMAAIGIFLAEPILVMLGVEADVVAEGTAYMRIMFVGSIAMSFRMMSESVMQASGDTVTPMRITIIFRLFHVALSPSGCQWSRYDQRYFSEHGGGRRAVDSL